MKRFRIVHTTEYRFEAEAFNLDLIARLRPAEEASQHCEYFQIVSHPPADLQSLPVDAFGNCGHRLRIDGHLQRMQVSAVSTVRRFEYRKDGPILEPGGAVNNNRMPSSHPSLYLQATRLVPLSNPIRNYALQSLDPGISIQARAEALCRRIHADLKFKVGSTHEQTNAEEVLASRQGVCQDFAHLTLGCMRSLGWAARYVSGYVDTAPFRGKSHRIAADASHAWLEVYDPLVGWLGLDPTHDRRPDDYYIIVARGRDYDDVCPLQGTFEGGGGHHLRVSVDVQQID